MRAGPGARVALPAGQTILIVDDTPENLAILGELLTPHYSVRVANTGARALVAAERNPRPDLILLDILMPGMDGFAVLEQLRENPLTCDIPVIFVTAMESSVAEERGLEQGAVDYITRPIQPQIVLARVRTHLELKHTRDLLQDQTRLLEAEVARRMADNLVIQDVSIRALASLAEVRDTETGHHLLRTQGYVRALAQALHEHPNFAATLTPAYIETLVKSAPLHDIGKVGIPDSILLKPGPLTPSEWEIMKRHARLGRESIEHAERDAERPVAFFDVAKEIANWHHEKWSGAGYPDGLRGEQIPICARLMAVADVYDALISRRVYKTAFAEAEAVAAIRAGSGSHFDPEVVEAFLRVQGEFGAIAKRYADADAPPRRSVHTGELSAVLDMGEEGHD